MMEYRSIILFQIIINPYKNIKKFFEQGIILIDLFLHETSPNIYIFWRIFSADVYFLSFLHLSGRCFSFKFGILIWSSLVKIDSKLIQFLEIDA
jgi:hypothetical protein